MRLSTTPGQIIRARIVAALLADWEAALPALTTAAAPAGDGVPVSSLRVLPPVTPPDSCSPPARTTGSM